VLILGLDPGLTRCGVGLVELTTGREVHFDSVHVLRSDTHAPLEERLFAIGEQFARVLDAKKPSVVALERVFAQHNVSTVMGTAQVSGVVMFLAAQRGIPTQLYTPSEVKAAVTGYGSADKSQVTAMVTRLLKLAAPPKPADAADALALAITHAWRGNRERRLESSNTLGEPTPAQVAWLAAERRSKRDG